MKIVDSVHGRGRGFKSHHSRISQNPLDSSSGFCDIYERRWDLNGTFAREAMKQKSVVLEEINFYVATATEIN